MRTGLTLVSVLLIVPAMGLAAQPPDAAPLDGPAAPGTGDRGGAPGPRPDLPVPAPPCADTPVLVDECGDLLAGDLAFDAGRGIRFDAGGAPLLTARAVGGEPGVLVFDDARVCTADPATRGCVTGIVAGAGLTGGGSPRAPGGPGGDVPLGVDFDVVQRRLVVECLPGEAMVRISVHATAECRDFVDAQGDVVHGTLWLDGGLVVRGDRLDLQPGVPIAWAREEPGGRVTRATLAYGADGVLRFGGNALCHAGAAHDGCGDIARVVAGHGLTGGAEAGAATLAVDEDVLQHRVAGACQASEAISRVHRDGAVECRRVVELTDGATGPLAVDGPLRLLRGSLTLSLDGLHLPQPGGANLRLRAEEGTMRIDDAPVCTAGSTVPGCGGAAGWTLAGNAGTTPSTNFLGTTDAQPLELRANNERALRLEPVAGGATNVLAGHRGNARGEGVVGATIAGGGAGGSPNRVLDNHGTVGGGYANVAGDDADAFPYDDQAATVAGGAGNEARGGHSAVGGGTQNLARGEGATIAGGVRNAAGPADLGSVGGGDGNEATGYAATVAGGFDNAASGAYAAVPGGGGNVASGPSSVAMGSGSRAAGEHSLAAGRTARADHDGAFVWADGRAAAFPSTAAHEFSVRATGGVRFVSALDGLNNPGAGVRLAPGDGAWTTLSDRDAKTAFAPVDPLGVLAKVAALPLAEWSYNAQGPGVRHLGPTAQDFHAAFGLGASATGITTVDADGVALAAIQGLWSELQRERARGNALEARLAALEGAAQG